MAQAQIDFLNSEAFNFETHTKQQMDQLAESADAHVSQLEALVVNTDAADEKAADAKSGQEPEDDFDETLSTDDTMIKDFNEIFDQSDDGNK